MALQQLTGVSPETVTLGQLFTAYADHKGATLKGQWKQGTESRAKLFLAAWGSALIVGAIGQTQVDSYSHARRSGQVAPAARAARLEEGKPVPPLRDGALDADFRWLSSVFNWGRKHKLPTGKRLLDHNPLADTKWPREKNPRRPVASAERYTKTLEHADAMDPSGSLRLALTLARETGRRESAILQLRASDVLLSTASIGRALAEAGKDEGEAAGMPYGAIRWRGETDKQGLLHITPISPAARAALELHLARHLRVGDVPLMPGPIDATTPLSRQLASRWLARAEVAAGLPKLAGGAFHPYRRLWASERRHLADVDVIRAGGWKSVKTLAIYQQTDPAAVLAAVLNVRAG
jgi:integrase